MGDTSPAAVNDSDVVKAIVLRGKVGTVLLELIVDQDIVWALPATEAQHDLST